jgi:hypothetical protein
MLLECYAIWINSNNDFGIFLRPIIISFTPKEKEIYNYGFLSDSDDENLGDIPDTEINNNIYTNINKSVFNCNNLIKKLNLQNSNKNKIEEENPEESVFSAVENININPKVKNDNNTSSDNTSYNDVDAETSQV